MQTPRFQRFRISLLLLIAAICQISLAQDTAPSPVAALQPAAQADRIARNADLGPKTQLTGHIPGWVTSANQVASHSVDLSSTMHLTITLRRDPAVEAAFTQFLSNQQDPSSPLYHQWLTPQQVGQLFGLTDSDIAAISGWLTGQGLTVSVEPSRNRLKVTGSAASIAAAFHISFAYFNAAGQQRLSAIAEPFIPTALAPVLGSIGGLTEIPFRPYSHAVAVKPDTPVDAAATGVHPNLTVTNNGTNSFYITPKDFAVIYDISGTYSGGNTGATIGSTAQHIAIMGQSRVAATDISEFATNVSLGSYNLNTIVPPAGDGGVDPGVTNTGDQDEATLDVDRVIGTAPGAIADLVVSTEKSGGIDIGLDYNVNTLLDPIQTVSFGACEIDAGQAAVQQDNQFFQQAAAEGISTFISSDDSGANGCAASFTPVTAGQTYTASINYLCSSSYVTCVGGTEFNDTANPSLYWSTKNGTGLESALSYIPEGGWNEPSGSCSKGTYCPAASGGGASIYIAKPSWQAGTGVPNDGARDTPDVAFASASHDGYYACLDYSLVGAPGIPAGANCTASGGGYFSDFSGTSTAAPGMAGITALLNTKTGTAHGNINPLLYSLAASSPNAFHDVTVATSGVTGCAASTPSMCNNSTPGAATLTGGLAGYLVTAGYDEVTGLGSLDVGNFLNAASSSPVSTSLSVAATPNPVVVNQTVTLTATLTPGTSSSTPTGTVQFYANNTALGSPITLTANSASTNTSFFTSGTYSITAVYSGDANFATSTASAASLTVNAPNFTVTPATTTYNLISGATSGSTDNIAVASVGSFAGVVALNCTVSSASGTAAGSCSITPPSATLTSGGSSNSTLLITTTPGTSGVLNIRVTGSSGSAVVTSAAIVATLTAPSFTLAASPTILTFTSGASSGNTDTITVASANGFTGSVALGCSISTGSAAYPPTCSISPATVTVSASGTAPTAVVTVNSTVQTAALDRRWAVGNTTFIAFLLFLPALRRRRKLLALALLFCGVSAISGCGGSSTPAPTAPKSSAGTYTVTITGTGTTTGSSIATTASANFSLTIN